MAKGFTLKPQLRAWSEKQLQYKQPTHCSPGTVQSVTGHNAPAWGADAADSQEAAQLLRLAQSPGTASVKLHPEQGTAPEKFKGSCVSFLQADLAQKDQETEITFLKPKHNTGTYMITRKLINHS